MSGFRINTNVSALGAQRSLGEINRKLAGSMERLSSGLRINRAADDAAGLAISERFKTQINGINQAIRNIQDGISLIQVAEGGISTIGDMVQRIRSLAVQAANDTLTDADRGLIQTEVDQLLTEVDRQATTVSFNGKTLLTGQYSGIGGPVGAPVNQTFDSAGVVAGDARPNYYRISNAAPGIPAPGAAGEFEFISADYIVSSTSNGASAGFNTGIVGNHIGLRFQFQPGATPADVTSLQFNFVGGSSANGTSPDNIRYQLYDFQASAWVDVGNNNTGTLLAYTAGTSNAQVVNPSRFFDPSGDVWAQAWVETARAGGGNNDIDIDYASLQVTTQAQSSTEGLKIQAGANQGETVDVFIQDFRRAALGLNGLSVSTRTAAEAAITTASNAITKINGSRADLGAVQNRLEQTLKFSAVQGENQAASNSRIRDLDFADEIIEFTKRQILQQAGTSALAQANVGPQAVLQL